MRVIRRHGQQDELEPVRSALRAGQLIIVPTDTVYGLAALADDEAAVLRMYEAKGRPLEQPTAIIFRSLDELYEQLPGMDARTRRAVQMLLPGPWTLIVSDPHGHWPWLCGRTPGSIGVRVPDGALDLPPIAATSANLAGDPTAAVVGDLATELQQLVAIAVDDGPLQPQGESTVLDITTWSRGQGEVRVLRDTACRAGAALMALDSST